MENGGDVDHESWKLGDSWKNDGLDNQYWWPCLVRSIAVSWKHRVRDLNLDDDWRDRLFVVSQVSHGNHGNS